MIGKLYEMLTGSQSKAEEKVKITLVSGEAVTDIVSLDGGFSGEWFITKTKIIRKDVIASIESVQEANS
jgi:hypothetical protein